MPRRRLMGKGSMTLKVFGCARFRVSANLFHGFAKEPVNG